jgi:hypothetical protein
VAIDPYIVLGSAIVGLLVGSLLSSRVPDRYIRPAIAFVIFASGLKYVGVATTVLGWILCATLTSPCWRVSELHEWVFQARGAHSPDLRRRP